MSDLVEIGANALRVVEGCSADMSTCGLCTKNTSDCCRNAIRAVYAAIEKAGYRIVPFDPTDAMEAAAEAMVDPTNPHKVDVASNVWFAMLAAAPKVS